MTLSWGEMLVLSIVDSFDDFTTGSEAEPLCIVTLGFILSHVRFWLEMAFVVVQNEHGNMHNTRFCCTRTPT
jgi:hypothetical protein